MSNEEETNVRIVGVSIPFFDKVWLLVGFAFASIPALIIVTVTSVLVWSIVQGFLEGNSS